MLYLELSPDYVLQVSQLVGHGRIFTGHGLVLLKFSEFYKLTWNQWFSTFFVPRRIIATHYNTTTPYKIRINQM